MNALIRRHIEVAIESLIALLDALDGDPDLEPTMGCVVPGHLDEAEEDDPPEHDLRNAPRRPPRGQRICGPLR